MDDFDDDDDFDFWRLCDELSIRDAALLISGVSPAKYSDVERKGIGDRPKGYEAAKTAMVNALRKGRIPGEIEEEMEYDMNGPAGPIHGSVSIDSRVEVEGLRSWLLSRGMKTGFFFPEVEEVPDYMNPQHPRYAPKLAAAVRAWLAVTDPGGKHPKQALAKWLREHATEFGLSDDEGKPIDAGIEDAAKVANWQPLGGAPKTPTGQSPQD